MHGGLEGFRDAAKNPLLSDKMWHRWGLLLPHCVQLEARSEPALASKGLFVAREPESGKPHY